MSIRRGRAVSPDAASLAAAFPDATPKVVVFVHGLCETEDAWRLAPLATRRTAHASAGRSLASHRCTSGTTPVATSRRTVVSLRDLVHELARRVAAESMRSRCRPLDGRARVAERVSLQRRSLVAATVRHVFTLGTPHRAPRLRRAATVAATASPACRRPAASREPCRAQRRDQGPRARIPVDEDWADQDPEAFFTRAGSEIAFLTCANHYFVCATLSREPDAPVGRIIGDLLVLAPSAWPVTAVASGCVSRSSTTTIVGGANHFDLLNHPAIYDQLSTWLAGRPALPVGAAAE